MKKFAKRRSASVGFNRSKGRADIAEQLTCRFCGMPSGNTDECVSCCGKRIEREDAQRRKEEDDEDRWL